MIDLHTHTIFSDGELLPFELVKRAEAAGYRAIAITDHVDTSNIDFAVPRILKAVKEVAGYTKVKVIAGAEITHVPPPLIKKLVAEARRLGAQIVVVHGETLVEPVEPGTNRAAIEAGADILAHPGLISPEDASLAREKGVALEITARKGHCLSNGHVLKTAIAAGARFTLNTDTHSPGDLISAEMARKILRGAGLEAEMIDGAFKTAEAIVERAGKIV